MLPIYAYRHIYVKGNLKPARSEKHGSISICTINDLGEHRLLAERESSILESFKGICQRKAGQSKRHESIDKDRAISQYEHVAQNWTRRLCWLAEWASYS
jgi:hypothetical protein